MRTRRARELLAAFEQHGRTGGEYFLDNHWPSVQFDRLGKAVDHTKEA